MELMRLVSIIICGFVLLIVCSSCVQYEYSQFRSEEENQMRFAELFYKSIQTCDGRNQEDHQRCVADIKVELAARFEDRNKAFMTKAQAVQMMATQLIIQYQFEKAKKSVRASSGGSNGGNNGAELAFEGNENIAIADTIRTTRARVCRAAPFSFSFSMGNYVPIVCN
jgi:hypothetical protein